MIFEYFPIKKKKKKKKNSFSAACQIQNYNETSKSHTLLEGTAYGLIHKSSCLKK